MALPNTTLTPITTTGAGEGLTSAFQKTNANDSALLANDIFQENEIAANTQAIANILARLGGMIGTYSQPTSTFTYGQASALWNTATVVSTLNSAANVAIGAPIANFDTGQKTSANLPIWAAVSVGSNAIWVFTYSVSATGALTQLASTSNANPYGTNCVGVEILGAGSFRLHSTENATVTTGFQDSDVAISATGAVSFSVITTPALSDKSGDATIRSGSQNNLFQSTGSGTVTTFGTMGTEFVPFVKTQARASAGAVTGTGNQQLLRLDSFVNTAAVAGWANLGGGFFLVAATGKRPLESARLNFYLIYADDAGVQRLGVFSFNALPTAVQVSVLSNSLALVKFVTSNNQFMIPIAITVASKTFNYAMNAQNQSNQYVTGGGFSLPMADTVAYNATSGVMVTKEGSGSTNPNVFAFRPFTFDTTQAANPALAETASPITFSFGQGIDTTGTMNLQLVSRFSSDIVILVGNGGSGGSPASALCVQSMSLTKQ